MVDPRLDEIIEGVETIKTAAESKQEELVSGENIKTVNNQSLLGAGNLEVGSGITVDTQVDDSSTNPVENRAIADYVDSEISLVQDQVTVNTQNISNLESSKQNALVSGTNIKTINEQSILGSGNLDVGSDITVDSSVDSLSNNPVENRAIYAFVTDINESLGADINEINSKIPAQATSDNQLADKDFVNSSISTATATFRGTFTSLASLQAANGDKNDYAFYSHTDVAGNTIYDRYKYVGIKEKRLPEGYTEVASVSGGYINLNIIPRFDWHVIIKVSSSVFANNSAAVPVFGVREDNTRWEILKPSYENPLYVLFSSVGAVGRNVTNNDVHTIEVKSNGTTFFDGSIVGTLSTSGTAPTLSAYLLGIHRTNDAWRQNNVACYGLTIYDSEENLLADLVPGVQDSAGSIGVYDLTGNINPDTNSPFYGGATRFAPLSEDKWEYEYSLNNSSFTADQWAAINSGLAQNVTSTGYDATATQVLKNINGIIQWVTE